MHCSLFSWVQGGQPNISEPLSSHSGSTDSESPSESPKTVRRSTRGKALAAENDEAKAVCARASDNDLGLTVFQSKEKGRGVRTEKMIKKGTIVLEYCGTLLTGTECRETEAKYGMEGVEESFVFHFKYKGKPFWYFFLK